MFVRIRSLLQDFFFPPPGSGRWRRLFPYITMGILSFVVLIGGAYGWEYTNSPEFCGTACHTMPPEYTAYLTSPHARVDCVDCHIGKGFIATRITRKAGDAKHIISLAFKQYEFPITADDLRPARETCEQCHFPEKFSDDSLIEIKRYLSDQTNTPVSIYLTLKTGGGSRREGLGQGIHWHIENQTFYLPLDDHQQEIPYVRVVASDGTIDEYFDTESGLLSGEINQEELVEMDCITCHNRITHFILPPDDTVDLLMSRGSISADIPEIRQKAVEVYSNEYSSVDLALSGIAGLKSYYLKHYLEFYSVNYQLIDAAILALQDAYASSVYPEQKADWNSHPNNAGHKDAPGCFRCHDGKHLNAEQEAIRLECNVCHSIPVVAGPSDFISEIKISRGPEPQSHLNPNWITLHRDVFDASCTNCHTTENPGGVDNSSFCANSACHGSAWEFAGFDAPTLREILQPQLAELTPSEPTTGEPTGAMDVDDLTYDGIIGSMLIRTCMSCHGPDGLMGLNVSDYNELLAGGDSGAAVVPNNPDGSLLIQKQTGEQPHFAQLTPEEILSVITWIDAGAPEN
jgi:nitrate/TMAO reductase-like tetraheme cytochrome c subunit/mono/diheme cytochrome c family protein